MLKKVFKEARYDFPAGLVVFLVALPLCLGIALASNAPPFSGIIAGIVGGIVVGFASKSSLSVSGPAAGLTIIVADGITSLNGFDEFLVAVILAGIIQILLSVAKAGIIGYFFPSSVIKGMLASIGLILIIKQLPHAIGYDQSAMIDEMGTITSGDLNMFQHLWQAIQAPYAPAIFISSVALALLLLGEAKSIKKIPFFKYFPFALIAVLSGIFINYGFELFYPSWAMKEEHLVQIPSLFQTSNLSEVLILPDFKALTRIEVYGMALVIALIASLESLLSVEAADKIDPYKRVTPTNRELFAQGLGNLTSGIIGGLPITAVIVRTSANVQAGGRTKLSTIFHGVLLAVAVLAFPTFLNKITYASLAAILLFVGFKLTTPKIFRNIFKLGWAQFLPFFTTIVSVLALDLLKGILVGFSVALFFILKENFQNSYSVKLVLDPNGNSYNLELAEEVSFLNKASIQKQLENIPNNSNLTIDGSKSKYIDFDVLEIIADFKEAALKKGIKVITVNLPT